MEQAVLEGALTLPGYARGGIAKRREYQAVKWIPQGWQWVDPQKEFNAMKAAIRAGLMSRSEAISAYGYDAEDVDREIAADNARADAFGLVFDSDPRHELPTPAPVVQPPDNLNRKETEMQLPHLASRLYGTPLLVARSKLDIILAVLGRSDRLARSEIRRCRFRRRVVCLMRRPVLP